MQQFERLDVGRLERIAFALETSWNLYQLEQSLQVIPEESPQTEYHFDDYQYHSDDYEYQLEFEECIEEPEVKQLSRFFRAITTWLDNNPTSSEMAFAHPGGWLF